jgi:hypothetical protein
LDVLARAPEKRSAHVASEKLEKRILRVSLALRGS